MKVIVHPGSCSAHGYVSVDSAACPRSSGVAGGFGDVGLGVLVELGTARVAGVDVAGVAVAGVAVAGVDVAGVAVAGVAVAGAFGEGGDDVLVSADGRLSSTVERSVEDGAGLSGSTRVVTDHVGDGVSGTPGWSARTSSWLADPVCGETHRIDTAATTSAASRLANTAPSTVLTTGPTGRRFLPVDSCGSLSIPSATSQT